MGTELVPEKSENFHTLTRLSAREDFTEFCRRESLKTYTTGLLTAKERSVITKP
jgi:hypothetical protein